MAATRVQEKNVILRSWKRKARGYDKTAKLVNASYARAQDIRQTRHNPVTVAIPMT